LTRMGIYELVEKFAVEFQVDHEIAFASLLAGFAHSLGGAFEIDSSLGVVRPPFSLLVVTPESDAVWSRIPLRFLVDDFESTMRAFANVNLPPEKDFDPDSEQTPKHPIAEMIARRTETAKAVYGSKVAERIATPSLVAPFPRLPFDHHVLLTNPPAGLDRAWRTLSADEKIRLEQALSSNAPMPPRPGEESSAAPTFYWQVDGDEVRRFLERNPWFAGMPFLMLESPTPGAATLGVSGGCASEIERRCFELFIMRHRAMLRPNTFTVHAGTFQPLRDFLAAAQAWESRASAPSPVRPARVAESALRFALLLTVLDKKPEPDQAAALMGLELAKRLHIRHLMTLAKFLPVALSEAPNVDGLSERERVVYFRVCERPGLTPSKLSRSFRRMNKAERDQLLAALVERRLIRFEGGRICREEPQPSGHRQEVPLPR